MPVPIALLIKGVLVATTAWDVWQFIREPPRIDVELGKLGYGGYIDACLTWDQMLDVASWFSRGKLLNGVFSVITKSAKRSWALSSLSREALEEVGFKAASLIYNATGKHWPWKGCWNVRTYLLGPGPTGGFVWFVPDTDVINNGKGVPAITNVTFPSSIPEDGVLRNGIAEFTDNNKGVIWAQFDVSKDTSGSFKPFGFDPGVRDLTEGTFSFHMWCRGDFYWTMRVTLRDVQGHVSNPHYVPVKCNPVSARGMPMTPELSVGSSGGP